MDDLGCFSRQQKFTFFQDAKQRTQLSERKVFATPIITVRIYAVTRTIIQQAEIQRAFLPDQRFLQFSLHRDMVTVRIDQ